MVSLSKDGQAILRMKRSSTCCLCWTHSGLPLMFVVCLAFEGLGHISSNPTHDITACPWTDHTLNHRHLPPAYIDLETAFCSAFIPNVHHNVHEVSILLTLRNTLMAHYTTNRNIYIFSSLIIFVFHGYLLSLQDSGRPYGRFVGF